MSRDVDNFVKQAKQWREEIKSLRAIMQDTGLEESCKWSKPCYAYEGSNIAIIQPFKGCLGLMFFKGALLDDKRGLLVDNGPNSQAARRLEFRSVEEVSKLKSAIKAYVKEATKIEASGQKVEAKKSAKPAPDELVEIFKKKPKLKKAFEALTPGRQRAYMLHFSGAKQSATRIARIEKCMPRILEGKGMNDR